MTLSMRYADYLYALRGRENDPVSLKILLAPFGVIDAPPGEDEFLLIGHFIDALGESDEIGDTIDAAIVIDVAEDLGVSLSGANRYPAVG